MKIDETMMQESLALQEQEWDMAVSGEMENAATEEGLSLIHI